MAQPRSSIRYDLHDPAVITDPYPTYAKMRQADPVWHNPASGTWTITRYLDVQRVLLGSECSNHRVDELLARVPADCGVSLDPLRHVLAPRLLFTEGEQHTRIKRLMMKTFAHQHVESYGELISGQLHKLLDGLSAREPVDLLARVTNQLPGLVILAILGIRAGDEDRMKSWTDEVYAWIGHSSGSIIDRTRNALSAVNGLRQRLLEIIADARRQPRNDMLSALVHAEDDGQILDDDELVANVIGLVNAGQETTTCLLANGVVRLMQFPDQWARLKSNPELVGLAVEEMLRYDAPAQFIARRVERPFEVRGVPLEPGTVIALGLAAANRDEAAFPKAAEFDLGRTPNAHLSFGHGIHQCVGSALARLEAKLMFTAIIERFPGIRLACTSEELRWRPTTSFRCPVSLPVVLQP